MKPVHIVAIEAIVVGVGLIGFAFIAEKIFPDNKYLMLFTAGVLFHLVFEYTTVNKMYSIDYCMNYA